MRDLCSCHSQLAPEYFKDDTALYKIWKKSYVLVMMSKFQVAKAGLSKFPDISGFFIAIPEDLGFLWVYDTHPSLAKQTK